MADVGWEGARERGAIAYWVLVIAYCRYRGGIRGMLGSTPNFLTTDRADQRRYNPLHAGSPLCLRVFVVKPDWRSSIGPEFYHGGTETRRSIDLTAENAEIGGEEADRLLPIAYR